MSILRETYYNYNFKRSLKKRKAFRRLISIKPKDYDGGKYKAKIYATLKQHI